MAVCLASTSYSFSRLFTIIFLRIISTDRNLLHTTGENLKLQNCPRLFGVHLVTEVLSLGKIGPRLEAYRSPPSSAEITNEWNYIFFLLLFFHWHYSPLWALACRTISFYFFLSATNSLHLLNPSTWRSLSTSSFHLFLGLPLLLVPSSSWVKIFLGVLSSSILSRWPNQLILCSFIHFTMFSP